MMSNKKWTLSCLVLILILMIVGALPTVIIDPFFHYHAPLKGVTYIMNDQRYQNDGILRHFSYDAVITGSSMTENFKTAEFDALFGTSSVKTSFPGARYKEIADRLNNAFRMNSDIRYVLWGVDCERIADHKDDMYYDYALYPNYLYDWKFYNDASYVFNKEVLFDKTIRLMAYTRAGIPGNTFDEYNYWSDTFTYGAESIKADYTRPEKATTLREVSQQDLDQLRETITHNIVSVVEANPNTQFYLFFTPYSNYWWDYIQRIGELEFHVTLLKEASRLLLEQDNIHLFSFFDAKDVICNPNYYKDVLHHSGEINSQILQWIKAGEHRLTKDNYAAHWDAMQDFYGSFDYDILFE